MIRKRKEKPSGSGEGPPPSPKWVTKRVKCPEGDYEAHLLIEKEGGEIMGISCDNPRFFDLDNWDCRWSCWERIKEALEAGNEA